MLPWREKNHLSRLFRFPEPPLSYGFSTSYYEATSTDEEPGLYFVREFDGNVVKFYLRISEAPDRYAFYLEEPKEPTNELFAILEGVGFAEKEG